MDSPPAAAHGTVAPHGPTLPPSALDGLSDTDISQIQTELSTELYGFTPLSFTSRVVDLANEVIYSVIDKVEVEVTKKWAGEDQSEESRQNVQKGINRLETLLMSAVDMRFDQAEVWLLRNTFRVPVEVIPYILLPHHPQEGFLPYSKPGEDDRLMKELEVEIKEVKRMREEVPLLDAVEERLARRTMALKKVKSGLAELLTAGGARDTLSQSSKSLASSIPSYISQVRALISSPHSFAASKVASSEQPWKHSREAYLAWVAKRALEDSNTVTDGGDERMEALTRDLAAHGNAPDARNLKALLDT